MSSNCPECWDSFCTCGYMYRNLDTAYKLKIMDALRKSISEDLLKISNRTKNDSQD